MKNFYKLKRKTKTKKPKLKNKSLTKSMKRFFKSSTSEQNELPGAEEASSTLAAAGSPYASAETSPTQSTNSLKQLSSSEANVELYKSAESSANNSFSDLNSAYCSLSAQPAKPNNHIDSTESHKSLKEEQEAAYLDELNREFQSLPHYSNTLKKKVAPVEKQQLANIAEKRDEQSAASPTVTRSSSVLSFIEKMFVKTSPSQGNLTKTLTPQATAPTTTTTTTTATATSKPDTLTSVLQSSSISSSSPNPECSPYKLLDNEIQKATHQRQQSPNYHHQNQLPHCASTLSPNGTTINDAVALFNASSSTTTAKTNYEKIETVKFDLDTPEVVETLQPVVGPLVELVAVENKIIENLALINCNKEHAIADPILQSSSTNVHNSAVPVDCSSSEFTLNLNFKLASAAAAFASAPVVVTDNTKALVLVEKPLSSEKLTYNASTSSIHNDLKKILEEGKQTPSEKPKTECQATISSNKLTTSPISVTTTPQTAGQTSDLIKMMMTMIEANKLATTTTTSQQQPQPPNESPKSPNSIQVRYNSQILLQIRHERADFIDKLVPEIFKDYGYCMNGKSWDPEKYFDAVQFPGEDLGNKVHQRQQHNSYPHHNKSNNTKHRNNSTNSYSNNNNTKFNTSNNNTSRSKKSHNYSSSSNNGGANETPQHLQTCLSSIESPEPLQVPKNSPKSNQTHPQKAKKSIHNLNSEFGPGVYLNIVSTESAKNPTNDAQITAAATATADYKNADKILLGLLNKTPQVIMPTSANVNILDILNHNQVATKTKSKSTSSSHSSFSPSSQNSSSNSVSASAKKSNAAKSNTINLDGLFGKTKTAQSLGATKSGVYTSSQQPRHYPQVFSAQELEMIQLNQVLNVQKSAHVKESVSDLFHSVDSPDENNNNSNAYKQLVKNLSNHPLSAAKIQKQKQVSPVQQSQDGTNILKQLLHINFDESLTLDKKPKSASKKSPGSGHKKSKSPYKDWSNASLDKSLPQSSDKSTSSSKFPSVNPHEKPFQSLPVESNPFENLIQKMKQSQLNQILELNKQEIDLKKKKVHLNSEYEHFNSLLNKIMPSHSQNTSPQSVKSSSSSHYLGSLQHYQPEMSAATATTSNNNSNSILKWFDNPVKY
jgi:hypothetical protein